MLFRSVRDQYAVLKARLAEKYPNDREAYTAAKADFIRFVLRKAMVQSYLGKLIDAKVDRPVGYVHVKGDKTLTYPINYGFIPGVLGGDDEELDVYFLGEDKPVESFSGKVIAIVHREDDVEDKLVACPLEMNFAPEQICEQILFQEKYYNTTIETTEGIRMHVSAGRK